MGDPTLTSRRDLPARAAAAARRLVLVWLLPILACGGGGDTALEAGIGYFERDVEAVEPAISNLFSYMRRRFGLVVTSATGQRLDAVPDAKGSTSAVLYRRLVDPEAEVPREQIVGMASPIDRMALVALYCDRLGLPADWIGMLSLATEAGGYALTQAALAGQWSIENGCMKWTDLAELQGRQLDRLVALVSDWDALEAQYEAPIDLAFEAMVMLYYLGGGPRVRTSWLKALRGLQRADGGWPRHPEAPASDPHTSALALWILLEQLRVDAPPIRWIPTRPVSPGL